jgi:large subunit ribosomal protein L25
LATSYVLRSEPRAAGHPNRDRRAGYVPAVMYGHRVEPRSLRVEAREFAALLSRGGAHHLVTLSLEGEETPQTVVIKEIQRHPVSREVVHVDFQAVTAAERIHAEAPLRLVGEDAVTKAGGILQVLLHALRISCLPQDLPEHIEVDIAALRPGDTLTVAGVAVPRGIGVLHDSDEVVCSVLAPRVTEAESPAAEGAAEGKG